MKRENLQLSEHTSTPGSARPSRPRLYSVTCAHTHISRARPGFVYESQKDSFDNQ